MRRIAQRKQFHDDLKRQMRRGKDIDDLIAVVELLAEEGSLPPVYRPYKLSGAWSGVWECHIEPDWLLIYTITSGEVFLIRTGTHDGLFAS
jgi:mRNA interferase YafQ